MYGCSCDSQRSSIIDVIANGLRDDGDPNNVADTARELYCGNGGNVADASEFAMADPVVQSIFQFGSDSTILENADEFGDFKEAVAKKRKRQAVVATRLRLQRQRGSGGRRGRGCLLYTSDAADD